MLDQKIAEVQNRNFQKSDYAEKRIADLENPDFDNYTFSLQYTSQRCSNVATSIYKILNQYTPNYKLKIVFTTIKLDSVIHPLLKPQKSYYQNCNVCYKYTCDCAKSYIGETQQLLHTRIKNHRTSEASVLNEHILTCSIYQQKFFEVLGVDQDNATNKEKLNYFEEHFSIIEKNLLHKNTRKIYEGALICLEKPSLNRQKEHKILNFLCPCFLNRPKHTAIT